MLSFVGRIEVLIENFVHREHVDFILLEDSTHGVVTSDHSFVVGILKIVGADIDPYPFDGLRSRELDFLSAKH